MKYSIKKDTIKINNSIKIAYTYIRDKMPLIEKSFWSLAAVITTVVLLLCALHYSPLIGIYDPGSALIVSIRFSEDDAAKSMYLYDKNNKRAVVRYLSDSIFFPLGNVAGNALEFPYVSFECGNYQALWSSDIWFSGNGQKFRKNISVEHIFELVESFGSEWRDPGALANLFAAASFNGQWNVSLLAKSDHKECSKYCSDINKIDGDEFLVNIYNPSGNEIDYSDEALCELEVCINGVWYMVPDPKVNIGQPMARYVLAPDEEKNFSFSVTEILSWYGDLPHGDYRIVVLSSAFEFSI